MQETQAPETVKLWSRCEAATLDVKTGEILLTDNVNPKYLVQDLVREIQSLQTQLKELKEPKPEAVREGVDL